MQLSFLESGDKRRIAYVLTPGKLPCVIFCGGFKSDMTGTKAVFLEEQCRKAGQMFIRFDYTGHGQSSGTFEDGTIGGWKSDALAVVDKLGGENIMLVGSSMGAWVSLLVAHERQEKIKGLVGIASAPDFTEKLIWEKLPPADQKKLLEEGVYYAPSCYGQEPYPITRGLIEEARAHLLLDNKISLNAPVRLLHGTKDEDVPWQISVRLQEQITSNDVTLTLIKDGNHRLSEPQQLEMMWSKVSELSSN